MGVGLLEAAVSRPGGHHPPCRHVARAVGVFDADQVAATRGVDHQPAAHIHPHVLDGCVEEHEVARLQVALGDRRAIRGHQARVVRKVDAELLVHVHAEAGAIHAGGGIGAGP